MNYKFDLNLGDWSDDGHGKTSTFHYVCNKSVEEVREIYFKYVEETGFCLSEICNRYEQRYLTEEQVETMKKLGFPSPKDLDKEGYIEFDDFSIWFMYLLTKADPMLEIKQIDYSVPMFHFYGFDKKDRHIGFFGYGLFY